MRIREYRQRGSPKRLGLACDCVNFQYHYAHHFTCSHHSTRITLLALLCPPSLPLPKGREGIRRQARRGALRNFTKLTTLSFSFSLR